MANPLFDNNRKDQRSGGIFGLIYSKMYRNIPEFRDLANNAKGKSLEQAFAEKGFDYNKYRNMSEDDMVSFMQKNGVL